LLHHLPLPLESLRCLVQAAHLLPLLLQQASRPVNLLLTSLGAALPALLLLQGWASLSAPLQRQLLLQLAC
jgi:hypothetical protein